jgi:bifunctional non-homologous end joining protein LigD
MKTVQSVELFFREGSSDKVYKASIDEVANGQYMVNFAYGRRGNTLTTGSKTASPVPYDKAADVYAKLVNSKTGKGYQVFGKPSGGPIRVLTENEARDTGVRPQLLNEIEETDVEKYLNDDQWCAQEKYDGRNRLLIHDPVGAIGTNRKGLAVAISMEITEEVEVFNIGSIISGEAMGEKVMCFDLISAKDKPYRKRLEMLDDVLDMDMKYLQRVYTAWTTAEKKALYKKLRKENAEGIVFKKSNALYSPGRPNSGGDQLKFKFVATASCIVTKINTKTRSIGLGVFDEENQLIDVGNVTVYPNQQIPKVGVIVEVKYLYYFPSGALFQPVLLGERDDIGTEGATYKQLKLKREEIDV